MENGMTKKTLKKSGVLLLTLLVLTVTACRQTNSANTPIHVTQEESKTELIDAAESKESENAEIVEASVSEENSRQVTFTDDLGNQVRVEDPQRTAALLGSFAKIWQLAGGDVVATCDDAWDELGLTLREDTVNLGGVSSKNFELLLSSEPDFIIASANTKEDMEWQENLMKLGVPVAYFDVSDFEDYLRMLEICTKITGHEELYEEYGQEVQNRVEEVISECRELIETKVAPTVLSLTASASFVKAKGSEGNILGRMLANIGAVNIADTDESLLEELSMEQIIACDPDFILIVQRGDDSDGMRAYVEETLISDPAWGTLSAVQNDRVIFMDKSLYALKPNERWGEAYQKLKELLFGEE